MRTAQQLYEGVEHQGRGLRRPHHLHANGLDAPRRGRHRRRPGYISSRYGDDYLPEKPNFYGSSNKAAQEAHEAIRPTSLDYPPDKVAGALKPDQLKLYKLIWERFVACQMTPAQWDSTTVLIEGGKDRSAPRSPSRPRAARSPSTASTASPACPPPPTSRRCPSSRRTRRCRPSSSSPSRSSRARRRATPRPRSSRSSRARASADPPPTPRSSRSSRTATTSSRSSAASTRPISARSSPTSSSKRSRTSWSRLHARDGGGSRQDRGRARRLDRDAPPLLRALREAARAKAHEELKHAKAEIQPAPEEYRCEKCGAGLVYRFGKNGRFLSCRATPTASTPAPATARASPSRSSTPTSPASSAASP